MDPGTAAAGIRAIIFEIRDELVTGLLGGRIGDADVARLRRKVDDLLGDPELIARLEDAMSDYGRWSFEDAVTKVDRMLAGDGLVDALGLGPSTVDAAAAAAARPSAIIAIPALLIPRVQDVISLSFLGQRPPHEAARAISDEFGVSARRAETIVRTELKGLANAGTESRGADVAAAAARTGIAMGRRWIHSSGSSAKSGPPVVGSRKRSGYAPGKARQRYEPRPHHKAMHGVTVPIDEKFTLTNPKTMQTWLVSGPYDEALPAGEVVNCYCDHAFVQMPE